MRIPRPYLDDEMVFVVLVSLVLVIVLLLITAITGRAQGQAIGCFLCS